MIGILLGGLFNAPPDYVYFQDNNGSTPSVYGVHVKTGQCDVTKLAEIQGQFEAVCSVSFDRKFLIVFSSPKMPPVFPSDGYTISDQRQASFTQETRLYGWNGKTYRLLKNFSKIGFMMDCKWNRQSNRAVIQTVGGMMTNETVPPRNIGVVDAINHTFRILNHTDSNGGALNSPLWNSEGDAVIANASDQYGVKKLVEISVQSKRRKSYRLGSFMPSWKPGQSHIQATREENWIALNAVFLPGGIACASVFTKDGSVHHLMATESTGRILRYVTTNYNDFRIEISQSPWFAFGFKGNKIAIQNWKDGRTISFDIPKMGLPN